MEVIADFMMEILPTAVGDWLSEHFFVMLMKKVKNKTLRMLISLVVVLLGFALLIGAVLAIFFGAMLLLK